MVNFRDRSVYLQLDQGADPKVMSADPKVMSAIPRLTQMDICKLFWIKAQAKLLY